MFKKPAVLIVLVLVAGILAGWSARSLSYSSQPSEQIRADLNALKFTNPLLMAGSDGDPSPELSPFSSSLDKLIGSEITSGAATDVSVYFRDFNTGRWTGVNENAEYSPASMMKVLVMLSALKIAENQPSFMKKEIPYMPDNTTKFYAPKLAVDPGNYSVDSLVSNMIIYSDNASGDALLSDKGVSGMVSLLYSLLRLPEIAISTPGAAPDYMSVKSYAAVFRALYNSSLLPWQLSEQALQILSLTFFKDGLVAGVPKGTVVSHKFGETGYVGKDGSVVHELHDCGIVYKPGSPYLICVMTKGDSFTSLPAVIAAVSKSAWDFAGTK